MRLRYAALLIMLSVAPVGAIEPAELSIEAQSAMWCGAAFSIAGGNLAEAGNTAGADAERARASTVLGKAYRLINNGALSRDDFRALAERYAEIVLEPFRSTDPGHTRADCEALAIPDAQ